MSTDSTDFTLLKAMMEAADAIIDVRSAADEEVRA